MLRPCNRSDCTTVKMRSTKRHPDGAALHPFGLVVGSTPSTVENSQSIGKQARSRWQWRARAASRLSRP